MCGFLLLHEHAIAIRVKAVVPGDGVLVGSHHVPCSTESAHQHEQRRLRQMKVSKQSLDDLKLEPRVNEEIGFSAAGEHFGRVLLSDIFKGANRSGPNGDDAAGRGPGSLNRGSGF